MGHPLSPFTGSTIAARLALFALRLVGAVLAVVAEAVRAQRSRLEDELRGFVRRIAA